MSTCIFTNHPNLVGESYFEHVYNALSYAIMAFIASILLLIHSLFPFILQGHGAKIIRNINTNMEKNKLRKKLINTN